jgi:hypothetical protein
MAGDGEKICPAMPRQIRIPSRSEAIRQLVELGMKSDEAQH